MTGLVHEAPRRATGVIATARWLPAVVVGGIATAWLVGISAFGDYGLDAGPSLNALVSGRIGRALQLQPLMGSFSLVVRAPFALAMHLAGHGELAVYRAGVVPCILATAAIGVALAARRGAINTFGGLVVVFLAILTPASIAAVQLGHPEEALCAALVVGAALTAERNTLWSSVLLGLALATKQWAVVAIPPVVWLMPRAGRTRSVVVAAALAAALTLPLVVGSGAAFARTSHNAATAPAITTRATVWYLVARHHASPLPGAAPLSVLPGWAAQLTHPLIVVAAPFLLLLVWRRRPTTADALALLSLALLLRCVLDPVDNEYYHLPFILALLAYETISRRDWRGLPVATLVSCAGLSVTFGLLDDRGANPHLINAVYLTWTAAVGAYLVYVLRRRANA